jgi:glyoxalase family protein
VATNEPGFDRDEDTANLGQALKLPDRYKGHRAQIESLLPAIDG